MAALYRPSKFALVDAVKAIPTEKGARLNRLVLGGHTLGERQLYKVIMSERSKKVRQNAHMQEI
jgi:hypothetical protein